MCVLLSSDPRRGCARDIKVTVPPRLRFESVGMMCWLHNNNSNSNTLSLTHWPKWSKDIKRIDRFFSRNLGSHRNGSAWITVNTVNMQSILSYRVLPKGAWDTFASQRDTDGKTIHESWAQQFLRARRAICAACYRLWPHNGFITPRRGHKGASSTEAEKGEKTITKLWHNFLATLPEWQERALRRLTTQLEMI